MTSANARVKNSKKRKAQKASENYQPFLGSCVPEFPERPSEKGRIQNKRNSTKLNRKRRFNYLPHFSTDFD
jgi:hypothetical protein